MKRDEKGRFAKKEEEGLEIMIGLPPLKRMLTWIFIIGVMMPWISIIRKNNLPYVTDLCPPPHYRRRC